MKNPLSIFPLELVVFPGQVTSLHVFESKYKELIKAASSGNQRFGIGTILENQLMQIGCEVEIIRINKIYTSGEMDIVVRGRKIFELDDYSEEEDSFPYPVGKVTYLGEDKDFDYSIHLKLIDCLKQLNLHLRIINTEDQEKPHLSSFDVAFKVGLSLRQQYQVISTKGEVKREKYLLNHCIQQLSVESQTAQLRDRIIFN